MRGDKVKKVFVWRLTEKPDVADLQEFQRKSVFLGRPPADNLALLVRRFNLENQVGCVLATEAEMLAWLRKRKLGMTRQTLKAIRDQRPSGMDEYGIRLWRSDGAAIIYNRDGMADFVKRLRAGRANGR